MGDFKATLRLPGESQALPATVQIHEGRMQVASGEHVIGDWDIENIEFSRIAEGFRITAEGEVLLLGIEDRASFEEQAAAPKARAKSSSRPKKASRHTASTAPKTKALISKGLHTVPVPGPAEPKTAEPKADSRLNRVLTAANDRFGSKLLPSWVFTKGGLLAVLGLIVICVVFGELVSNLLLIAGVVGLLTGGVTMLDSVIARRVLRHKVTPIQVVIGSGTVFVTGLLVGVVANQLWT
jgi:hypothetical protein